MPDDPRKQDDEPQERSFADILNEFETTSHGAAKKAARPSGKGKGKGKRRPATPALRGTVVGISGDFVLVDYGGKAEGIIASADLRDAGGNLTVQRGDTFDVAITGFNSEGMVRLSRIAGPRPRDWDTLKRGRG